MCFCSIPPTLPTTNGFRFVPPIYVHKKVEESKRKQGVEQQLQLREQLLKTGDVQRELMVLQAQLAGAYIRLNIYSIILSGAARRP